jgi:hypothetical protein
MNPTINIASTMSKLFAVTSWALAALLTAGCTSGGEAQPTPATEARATSAVETELQPAPQPDADERHVILSLRFAGEKADATLEDVRVAPGLRAQAPENPADALVALVDRDGRIVAEIGVVDPFVARVYGTSDDAPHSTPSLDEHPLWLALPLAPGAVEARWQDVRSGRTFAWSIGEALEKQCADDASAACRAYLDRR